MSWLTIAFSLVLGVPPASTSACPLCIGFPDQTAVDQILLSDCVALATLSPDDPFEFAPVEVLKGDCRGESIGLLVNSSTRKRLAADDTVRVVLLRSGRDRNWRSLGVVSKAYEEVIRRIVLFSEEWLQLEGCKPRVEFFLTLFGSEDPQIRELAYLEMGRAPYATIKQFGKVVKQSDFKEYLTGQRYLEWRALAILLLAQSDRKADHQFILDSFHSAERFGTKTNLAAWAAAAIELEPEATIEFIERKYFGDPSKSELEVTEVMRSLSLHGDAGDPTLREKIKSSYHVLVENHPQFAHEVRRDLVAWKK